MLGEGAMGVVYLARDPAAERPVAIKTLRRGLAGDDVVRFRREAEVLGRMRHPGIVGVSDAGVERGRPYLVMRYVAGCSLAELGRREGRLSVRRALGIARDVARALEHAHAHGVVHRDLKPANILIDEKGRAVVTDFGLARDLEKPVDLTVTGFVVGTPHYMAPEQATRGVADARSDVYALGVILFELLTGANPAADGATLGSVMRRAAVGIEAAPSALVPGLDPKIDFLCAGATARDPADRVATAKAFADDLEHLLASGVDEPAPGAATRPPRRAALIVATVLIVAVGAAVTIVAEGLRARAAAAARTESARLLGRAGDALARPGGAAAALEAADEAIDLDPERADAHVLRARALARLGWRDDALEAWDRAFSIEPTLVADHVHGDLDRRHPAVTSAVARWLGAARAATDDPAVAALVEALALPVPVDGPVPEALETLPSRAPEDARALVARSRARWRTGRFDDALADADALARRWPGEASHHARRGGWLMERRRYDEAGEALGRARSLDPGCVEAVAGLGWLAFRRLEIERARELLEEARALAPDSLPALVGLVRVHRILADGSAEVVDDDDRARSRELCQRLGERAVELEPESALALAARGFGRALESVEAARVDARAALAMDPREPLAYGVLTSAFSRTGEPGVEAVGERWLAVAPDPVEPLLSTAWSLFGTGRSDPWVARARERAPDDAEVAMAEVFAAFRPDPVDGRFSLLTDDARVARRHVALLEAAARDHPEYVEAFFHWSEGLTVDDALFRSRDLADAAVRRIHRIVEAQVDPGCGRCFSLCVANRRAEAYPIYLELVAIEPTSPRPNYEIATNVYLSVQDPERELGISREEALARALRHAQIAVEACDTAELPAYRAISLGARGQAELLNGLLDECAKSVREGMAALDEPLSGHPLHELVNDQARRTLTALDAELARRRQR